MKLRVLIYVDRRAVAGELAIFARRLMKDGRFEPVVTVDASPSEVPDALLHGTTFRRLPAYSSTWGRALRYGWMLPVRIGARLASFGMAIDYVQAMVRLSVGIMQGRMLLNSVKPHAVVVADDRIFRASLGLLKAAKQRGIPAYIVPFAVSDEMHDMKLRATHRQPRHHVLRTKVLAPAHVRAGERGDVMFYSFGSFLALRRLKMLPAIPWAIGGGGVDRIFVQGPQDRERLLRSGLHESRIALTGQCSFDDLHDIWVQREAVRARLLQQHDFPTDAKIVVLVVPPYREIGLMSINEHRRHINALVSAVKTSGAAVIASLHPRMERARYQFLAEEHGLKVAAEPLNTFIAVADVVVNYPSSTLIWSVLAGVPTIVLNACGFQSTALLSIPGAIYIEERELSNEVARVLRSPPKVAVPGQRETEEAAFFDGRCVVRMADVIWDDIGSPPQSYKKPAALEALHV